MSTDAYRAIGNAVINAQYFEITFVLCARLVAPNVTASSIEEVRPLNRGAFKTATAAILNELMKQSPIRPDFEGRMRGVIERRHILIHRWVRENPWDEASSLECQRFADRLSVDLNILTRVLVKVIYDWVERFPELRARVKELGDDWLSALPDDLREGNIFEESE